MTNQFGICPKCLKPFRNSTDEHYHPLDSSDFDFAMSNSVRASTFQESGVQDPGYVPPEPEPPQEQVIIHRHSDMSKENYDLLQQMALRVRHLEKRLSKKRKKDDSPF